MSGEAQGAGGGGPSEADAATATVTRMSTLISQMLGPVGGDRKLLSSEDLAVIERLESRRREALLGAMA